MSLLMLILLFDARHPLSESTFVGSLHTLAKVYKTVFQLVQ